MTPVFANILQPLIDAADWLLLRLHDNLGFAGGANAGLSAAFEGAAGHAVLLEDSQRFKAGKSRTIGNRIPDVRMTVVTGVRIDDANESEK